MKDPEEDMLCLQECDESVAEFYRLAKPKSPWGDCGEILVQGMTNCWRNDSTSPELRRTGPYVPPISFPGVGCVIVTESVRRELESTRLTGFSFVPAIKKVIVPIDWHEWDLLSKGPPIDPQGDGEPEDYIVESAHSPALARSMPNLWRMVIQPGATELRDSDEPQYDIERREMTGEIFVRAGSWNGADIFRADTTLHNYATHRARQWLLDRFPAWLAFRPVRVK